MSNEKSEQSLAASLPEPLEGTLIRLADQGALSAHMQRLALLIEEIQEQVRRRGTSHIPTVLVERRAEVYRAATALGDWINEFLAGQPSPAEIRLVRQQVVTPIREWSRASPLLHYSLGRPRAEGGEPEFAAWLLDLRPSGADIPALVWNDLYRSSIGGRAYRGRMELLVNTVRHEIERRVAAGTDPVRVLSLHFSGAGEFLSVEQAEALAPHIRVTCLDTNSSALRAAARALPRPLVGKFSFLRTDALRYTTSANQPTRPFDVIYGVSSFDHLGSGPAAQLANGCYSLLAPGGILLAGGPTPGVPPAERILRAWVTGWEMQYRDEAAWRESLARSGFNPEALRFDYEPLRANVVVSAMRSPAGAEAPSA